jgi:hypothetical protein
MKIHIWVRKSEAISGKITKYYNMAPQSSDWPHYVEVSISQDEFVKLEDSLEDTSKKLSVSDLDSMSFNQDLRDTIEDGGGWIVEQYNRNRDQKDWVKSIEEIPYVYEKNPDTGEVYKRKFGKEHDSREVVSVGVVERDYSSEKGLEELQKEMEVKTGAEFMSWFHKLTKNEKTKLTRYYND